MTASLASTETGRAAFVEKVPLSVYRPPLKQSLVGLTRAALGEALGEVGVPERQRRIRS